MLQALFNLLYHTEVAFNTVDGKLFAVFLDYSQAFDRVNRKKNLIKLQQATRPEHINYSTEGCNII
jgi:hypothetical protein